MLLCSNALFVISPRWVPPGGGRDALDQPSQHDQHSHQTQHRHCDKYHRVSWHVCQKLGHLLSPLQSPNARRRTPQLGQTSACPKNNGVLEG